MSAERRLRVQGLVLQVSLVWDDGEELTPGPSLDPVAVSPSQAAAFLESLPQQVAAIAAKAEAGQHEAGGQREA